MQGLYNIISFIALISILLMSLIGIPLIPIYLFLVFYGAKERADKAQKKLLNTLMENEQLIISGIQHRAFGLFTRRVIVGITDSRIIKISRGLFGGFTMFDIQWKDLRDAQLSENVLPKLCGSNLNFEYKMDNAKSPNISGKIVINGIPTDTATLIYGKAQKEEQSWEEKRRIRDLEEKRSAAGGIILGANMGFGGQDHPKSAVDTVYLELQKAKQLLDSGAVNDSEYQEMKSKILSRSSF